jgi:hypothetical protein
VVDGAGPMSLVSKQQAAKVLQVSIRTIERYAKHGKISPTFVSGSKSPSFEDADLVSLKAELESARPSKPQIITADPTPCIIFKLSPYYRDQLAQRAAKHGMTVGQFARETIISSLESAEQVRISHEIQALRELTLDLGKGIASSLVAVLSHAGSVDTTESLEFVSAHFAGFVTGSVGDGR